ncbi:MULTISPECIES: hypothetical protein [Klebsiella]|uniref:hypothetical protein n=1 Tax=Klebsiella TaxID=570 RepID=UPI0007CC369A|nr:MULTISPECIES: hypothetical protein [Klebsiella]SBL73773.1 Ead domain protein [Klebsiella grimontii]DAZ17318.1 MAG TPA: hypothetical protein [Caudoviricetes sp.]
MTTDITELAQRNELLIANGQQTADLLRHLADNEIDSDYFAVVSECESYGKETDAELSITEFALRAAGYVDALVEALEKAQAGEKQWREVVDAFCTDDADWHNLTNSNNELIALLSQALCKQADRIAELKSRTVKLPRPGFITISGERMAVYLKGDVDAAMLAAGIEEAE